MGSNFVRKGNIDTLESFVDPEAPWLILFHGFGADAADLFGLHDYLPTSSPLNWLCPNGVLQVPIGPGWMGRAWWNIRMAELAEDFSGVTPDELPALRSQIQKMIGQMKVPWNKIILGGFSQGAMLAVDTYLRAPETPRGLVILSGALICRPEWEPLVRQRTGESFYMSHGTQDQVLPISTAQKLHQVLTAGGMKGKLNSFSGGHEIPPPVMQGLGNYLESRL